VAFKTLFRKIVYMMISDVASILMSPILRELSYLKLKITILLIPFYYRASCKILNLKHGILKLEYWRK